MWNEEAMRIDDTAVIVIEKTRNKPRVEKGSGFLISGRIVQRILYVF